jgi:hypothetical protein
MTGRSSSGVDPVAVATVRPPENDSDPRPGLIRSRSPPLGWWPTGPALATAIDLFGQLHL